MVCLISCLSVIPFKHQHSFILFTNISLAMKSWSHVLLPPKHCQLLLYYMQDINSHSTNKHM